MNFDVAAVTLLAQRLHAGETLDGAQFAFPHGTFSEQSLHLTWERVELRRFAAFADLDERHHQPFGLVHGGVWAGLVEQVGSVAAQMQVVLDRKLVVGVHNATDFLRPFSSGRVSVVGEPVHIGKTQQLWQIDITRTDNAKALARGQLRVQVIDPERVMQKTQ